MSEITRRTAEQFVEIRVFMAINVNILLLLGFDVIQRTVLTGDPAPVVTPTLAAEKIASRNRTNDTSCLTSHKHPPMCYNTRRLFQRIQELTAFSYPYLD
jgi:hypothetical protein